jgi:type 1 fimbriae regulatory protein FimB/type 1 fimbriae regulatory protein FimE
MGTGDATMILIAFQHGLRASELCDLRWDQVEFGTCSATPAATPSPRAQQSRRRPSEKKGVLGLTSRLATAGVAAAGQRRPQKSAERSFEAAQCSHKSFRFACLGGR